MTDITPGISCSAKICRSVIDESRISKKGSAKAKFEKIFKKTQNSQLAASTKGFSDALCHLKSRSNDINKLLSQLKCGKSMSNADLLSLQGIMMNYERDLTAISKIVEHAVGAVKTTIQTQV